MRKISRNKLGRDIKEAIRDFRYQLSVNSNRVTVYNNGTAPYLPNAHGNTYYEYDVGSGRNDRGRARIVALVSGGGRLESLYFTNTHYGSWMEIV